MDEKPEGEGIGLKVVQQVGGRLEEGDLTKNTNRKGEKGGRIPKKEFACAVPTLGEIERQRHSPGRHGVIKHEERALLEGNSAPTIGPPLLPPSSLS